MKKIVLFMISIITLSSYSFSQPTYDWHTFYGSAFSGAVGTDRSYAVTYDNSGNIYLTGMSESTWTGPAAQAPLHAHSGITNVFILKLNSSGAYQWHTFFGGSSDCYGFDMTSDATGNLYITGFSDDTWNGPAPASQAPINAYSGSGRDGFALKLNSSGAYQWHTFFGATGADDEASGIILDGSDNVYVTGFSEGSWNVGASSPLNGYSGNKDVFVIKLNSSGAYQWHSFYGSADDDDAFNIACDSDDNVCIGGRSTSTWNGPGSTSPIHAHAGGGNRDLLIMQLNSSGTYQWHTFYGSSSANEEIRGINVDGNNNIVACGNGSATWQGDGATDPLHAFSGSADYIVMKLNSSGAYQWHTFYGSASANDYPNDLAVDTNNEIYVAGRSYASWQGDGATDPLHAFSGYRDISFMKLSAAGAYQWHSFYGSTGDDRGQDIVLNGTSLYLTGRASASFDGDDGSDTPLHAFQGGPGDAWVMAFTVPIVSTAIPTLSEWAAYSLFGLLMLVGGFFIWKKLF